MTPVRSLASRSVRHGTSAWALAYVATNVTSSCSYIGSVQPDGSQTLLHIEHPAHGISIYANRFAALAPKKEEVDPGEIEDAVIPTPGVEKEADPPVMAAA